MTMPFVTPDTRTSGCAAFRNAGPTCARIAVPSHDARDTGRIAPSNDAAAAMSSASTLERPSSGMQAGSITRRANKRIGFGIAETLGLGERGFEGAAPRHRCEDVVGRAVEDGGDG